MPYVNGILGRLTRDPEMKTTKNGKNIVYFTVANAIRHANGEDRTSFVRCTAYGKIAEVIEKNCKKGKCYIVEGVFENSPYKKDEKGYNIDNWVYHVRALHFLPKNNFDESKSDNTYSNEHTRTDESADVSVDDFTIQDDTTDFPF